jgi:hypothetical protein
MTHCRMRTVAGMPVAAVPDQAPFSRHRGGPNPRRIRYGAITRHASGHGADPTPA